MQDPLIICLKTENKEIIGVWVYDKTEKEKLIETIENIINSDKNGTENNAEPQVSTSNLPLFFSFLLIFFPLFFTNFRTTTDPLIFCLENREMVSQWQLLEECRVPAFQQDFQRKCTRQICFLSMDFLQARVLALLHLSLVLCHSLPECFLLFIQTNFPTQIQTSLLLLLVPTSLLQTLAVLLSISPMVQITHTQMLYSLTLLPPMAMPPLLLIYILSNLSFISLHIQLASMYFHLNFLLLLIF